MIPQKEAPFCAWYRGRTFSHCKDSRCLQKANAYTHTCTYKSSLNNSHHVLWPQQNNETREGALAPPLPMPLHMHEALENVAGKHHNNKLCYTCTYVHTYTLDTHARVKCVASTYGTYAHSYYECHIITTYTYMLEGEISLSQVPDAWCFTSQVPWHMATVLTDRYSYCGNCLLSCISLWRSDAIIYKPGSDVFQNTFISMYVHIRAAGSGGAGVAMATPLSENQTNF